MALLYTVPDQHLEAIGRVTVTFALLESEFRRLVNVLLGKERQIGEVVTAELSFQGLLALASSLHLERHRDNDAQVDGLKELSRRARTVEESAIASFTPCGGHSSTWARGLAPSRR